MKQVIEVGLDLKLGKQSRSVINDGAFIAGSVHEENPKFWYYADTENDRHVSTFALVKAGSDIDEGTICHCSMFVYDEKGQIKHELFLIEYFDPNEEFETL
jgi:hypothetical protein